MKHVDQESVHGMHHDALAHSRHTGKDTMLTMTPNLHLPQAATPYTFQDASWGEVLSSVRELAKISGENVNQEHRSKN